MLTSDFWKDVFFSLMVFLLCICYIHPINTCGSRAYGKKGKGLRMNAKGRKEDVNGRTVHSFVAIAYGKGVVMREQFLGK